MTPYTMHVWQGKALGWEQIDDGVFTDGGQVSEALTRLLVKCQVTSNTAAKPVRGVLGNNLVVQVGTGDM